MSKAILVLDRMPEECRLCRLIDYDYDQMSASCYFLREDVSKDIFADKPIRPPKKCPLREMPEPARHGHWNEMTVVGKPYIECSVCGRGATYLSAEFQYCPNCGAKMDGGAT